MIQFEVKKHEQTWSIRRYLIYKSIYLIYNIRVKVILIIISMILLTL